MGRNRSNRQCTIKEDKKNQPKIAVFEFHINSLPSGVVIKILETLYLAIFLRSGEKLANSPGEYIWVNPAGWPPAKGTTHQSEGMEPGTFATVMPSIFYPGWCRAVGRNGSTE